MRIILFEPMSSIALKAGLVVIVVIVSLATGKPALRTRASDPYKPALGFGEAFAMRQAVEDLQLGKTPDKTLSFSELKALVDFDGYDSVTQ